MKKAIFLFTVFISLVNITSAQQGLEVSISKVPEKVEILPGLYEFFGVIVGTTKEYSYVLTINEELVDELKTAAEDGSAVSFLGPKLEPLVQQKVIDDYARKRQDVEDSVREELKDAKKQVKSFSAFARFKQDEKDEFAEARTDKKSLQEELKKEQGNTQKYLSELKKIVVRYETNCIYAYNSAIDENPPVDDTPEEKSKKKTEPSFGE